MIPINIQTPEKRSSGNGEQLDVHSIFYTIQGEGPYVGYPALFIRLAGCNLQCPGCDTQYTDGRNLMGVDAIVQKARSLWLQQLGNHGKQQPPLIVITGGEPFRQPLFRLIRKFNAEGHKVQIETNGTLMPTIVNSNEKWPDFDVVVSPKAGKVHPSLYGRIIAYKYVVNAGEVDYDDGLPTSVLGMPARPARPHKGFKGPIYIQPAEEYNETWIRMFDPMSQTQQAFEGKPQVSSSRSSTNLDIAIKIAQEYGHILCIQTHKLLNLE